MRKNCLELYNFYRDNYRGKIYSCIVHYCCGSYENGDYGGVARYDYQLKLIYPKRIFFQGPKEKNKLLNYLKKQEYQSN